MSLSYQQVLLLIESSFKVALIRPITNPSSYCGNKFLLTLNRIEALILRQAMGRVSPHQMKESSVADTNFSRAERTTDAVKPVPHSFLLYIVL